MRNDTQRGGVVLVPRVSEGRPMTYQTPTYHTRPIRAALPGQVTLGTFAGAFFTFALVCD